MPAALSKVALVWLALSRLPPSPHRTGSQSYEIHSASPGRYVEPVAVGRGDGQLGGVRRQLRPGRGRRCDPGLGEVGLVVEQRDVADSPEGHAELLAAVEQRVPDARVELVGRARPICR